MPGMKPRIPGERPVHTHQVDVQLDRSRVFLRSSDHRGMVATGGASQTFSSTHCGADVALHRRLMPQPSRRAPPPDDLGRPTGTVGFTACGIASEPRARREPNQGRYLPHPVSYTHLRAHETDSYLVCRLL